MAKGEVKQTVTEFATIAFTLLGVLFGMMIMTFIFGQIGNSTIDSIDDETITQTNISGAYINATLYTISEASNSNFNGGFVVVQAINATGGEVIAAGNYTVDAAEGTIINATSVAWSNVNVTYTFAQKTNAKQASESTQNNSLNSIVNYTEQSDTQFITIAIAITLIILIAVFLLFWKIFVKTKGKGKSMAAGNFA
jgi:hypothetical protein